MQNITYKRDMKILKEQMGNLGWRFNCWNSEKCSWVDNCQAKHLIYKTMVTDREKSLYLNLKTTFEENLPES